MDENSELARTSEDPATPAVSEFPFGAVDTGLEKIRTRLLDLTTRNRLLNFRHSAKSSLRVVESDLDSVFSRLVDGEKVWFEPVPESPDVGPSGTNAELDVPKLTAEQYAQALGWRTSYDLPSNGEEFASAPLRVLLFPEDLEAVSRKLGSAAKTAIEESGTNMLFLILGFLEWYEDDNSQQARLAPLMTVPVLLDRGGNRGKGFECAIEYSGEDRETNLSLVERLRRDFGIEIPALDDQDTPTAYFVRLERILRQKSRWKIRRCISLALLSFGKLLMYRDLDPKGQSRVSTHSLVRELFEGIHHEHVTHADEYDIDSPAVVPLLPPLILDADSSQHSAMIDALTGRNLVIEGPPGTGKSQTITNLISAAMLAGKSVLFVAEKLAALEVVRRRLDEVGLGIFCLELHSHKTRKDALMKDLAARIQAQRSFSEPRALQDQIQLAEQKKQALTTYARLLARTMEPSKRTVFDVLWARERAYQALACDKALLEHLLVPDVVKWSRTETDDRDRDVANYVHHLQAVLHVAERTEAHPWRWVDQALNFSQEQELLSLVERLGRTLTCAAEVLTTIASSARLVLPATIEGLQKAGAIHRSLPTPTVDLDSHLVTACADPQRRAALSQFVRDMESARALEGSIRELLLPSTPVSAVLCPKTRRLIEETISEIRTLGLELKTAPELQVLWERGRAIESGLGQSDDALTAIRARLGSEGPNHLDHVAAVQSCLVALDEAPEAHLHLRSVTLEAEGVQSLVSRAREEAIQLREEHASLNAECDLSAAAVRASELAVHVRALEEAGLLQRLFGAGYRNAKRTYREIVRDGRSAPRATMVLRLRGVVEHLRRRSRFEERHDYRESLSPHFKGLETDWEGLASLAEWYGRLFTLLPEHSPCSRPYRQFLLSARAESLKAIRATLGELKAQRTLVTRLPALVAEAHTFLPGGADARKTVSDLRAAVRDVNGRSSKIISVLAGVSLRNDVPADRLGDLLLLSANYERSIADLDGNAPARDLLGANYAGTATDCGAVAAAVRFSQLAAASLPTDCCEWVLATEPLDRFTSLRDWLTTASECFSQSGELHADILRLAGGSGVLTSSRELAAIALQLDGALANRTALPEWTHFLRAGRSLRQNGFAKLVDLAETGILTPEQVRPGFQFVVYNTLARYAFSEIPELSDASGITQEQVRSEYAEADRKVIELFRSRVAAALDTRPVPYGNSRGPVGTWTEFSLIAHETGKQKRHIPIRQLVHRANTALQALKPCFMMGPLSVAQYLPPGGPKFDLVVMDEASQLRPEEAIGAIARGKQLVVVGDPKQLPPTTFFSRLAIEDEDEPDRTALEEGESILDVASTLYQPIRRLRWHYRSRHESLIAFSNREFYGGNLVVFPSPSREDPWLGVKYRRVNGAFEQGRNRLEAEAVVGAVIEHMAERPNESLGVATLNFEQRELIEELLDRRLRSDPFALAYQERMTGGPEPFFVKNLENVQGDERDVIFISATYGPDSKGHQYQRFGPINGENGHRRLNVLFTRAKRRTVVFSSLDPDQIQIRPESSRGLKALKQYLLFARSGVLETSEEQTNQPSNDFEQAVGQEIERNGFNVVPQVGVAGFFIDLGVRHPTKPGAFVLGVECDGATYHSGRSARDRDRLRQQILEGLGWRIHRIWSTDWFRNREGELKRLLAHVEAVLAADPDYRRERDRMKRVGALREKLTDLAQKIRLEFTDAPSSQDLLRPELLEAFLELKPQTKDDWFRRFSVGVRSATNARQVGAHLPKVLEIISESLD